MRLAQHYKIPLTNDDADIGSPVCDEGQLQGFVFNITDAIAEIYLFHPQTVSDRAEIIDEVLDTDLCFIRLKEMMDSDKYIEAYWRNLFATATVAPDELGH